MAAQATLSQDILDPRTSQVLEELRRLAWLAEVSEPWERAYIDRVAWRLRVQAQREGLL